MEDTPTPPEQPPIVVTTGDPVTIINVLLTQLGASERRIVKKIDDNADSAMRRWRSHDNEHEDLAKAVSDLARRFDIHLEAEERDQLIYDARVAPVKRLGLLLAREWRTILVAGLVVANFLNRALF